MRLRAFSEPLRPGPAANRNATARKMFAAYEIVDIGVNLAHRSFQSDRKEVVEHAFAVGVRTMIVTGTSLAGSQEALRIAGEYPDQLFATAGVHPHNSCNC